MANAMSTTRQHPLFRRKLLLLSAYILVASAKISTAPFLASGSPDKFLSTQPKIVVPFMKRLFGLTKEMHQPMTDLTKAVALRLRPFHNKIDFKVANMYNTRVFKKVTDKVMSVHPVGTDPMASVFDGILQAAGPKYKTRALGELFRQIMYFKHYPRHLSLDPSFLPIRSANKAINFEWCKNVFRGLEPHLLKYWKFEGLTATDLNELLIVDVTSSAFFDDEVILPRILSFQEQTRIVLGDSFDLVLNVYKKSLSDNQIATMLFANSDIKETKIARSLMAALFRDWTRRDVAPEALLFELEPSLDKNDFSIGRLNAWVMYFKPFLKEQLYPTLVRTLVKADDKSTRLRGTSNVPRDIEKELALADIIAAEWSKDLDFHSSRTPSSPLANPIFFALCSFWKEHRAKYEDMSVLLNIEHKNPLVRVARRRAWMTYMIVSDSSDATISLLYITLTEKEIVELISRVVNWDKIAYIKLSKPLLDRRIKNMKIRQKVFADRKLQSSGNHDPSLARATNARQ